MRLFSEDVTMLSFGGGQDSTALLYMLAEDPDFRAEYAPGRLIVVMSDTGNEHDETVAHVAEVARYCEGKGIEFVHITPDMGYHSGDWQSLEHFYASGDRIGSKAYPKTCTDRLKIQPIYHYMEAWIGREYGYVTGQKRALKAFARENRKLRVLIGIAAGEEKRVAEVDEEANDWMSLSVERVYPLIDLGMDRAACQKYIAGRGKPVPVPSHCKFCPFKTDLEVYLMARDQPADFKRWAELEDNKIRANREKGVPDDKNFGVFGRRTLHDVLEKATEKYFAWTEEMLHEHRMSHGHCVASTY